MKIVVATMEYNLPNGYDIDVKLEEIEFDGKLENLAKILDVTEFKEAEKYEDGSGGGCSSTSINISKNYTTVSVCDEYICPTAFIVDGVEFSGDRKVVFIGIENLIGNAPVYTLTEIQNKIKYPDYKKEA